jgi:hypothetical protein
MRLKCKNYIQLITQSIETSILVFGSLKIYFAT